jgi:uncharacterized membrane protein YdjX (TVP38/TMEM64 family)
MSLKVARNGMLRRALLAVAALALLYGLGRGAVRYVPEFAARVHALGFWGPLMFVFGYAAAVILFVPAVPLTLAAGAIFGLLRGTVYAFTAAVLGSVGAFLVSRYVARRAVERRLAADHRFVAIDRAVGEQGLRITLLLRLSPAFPFTLLNYALGLTGVSLADYTLASIGMVPGTLLYVYTGKVLGEVAAVSGGHAPEHGPAYYALLALGLAATIAVTLKVARIARRALGEAAGEE